MTYKCQGGCGRTVSGYEKWCLTCFPPDKTIDEIIGAVVNKAPERRSPERESLRMRLDLLHLAHEYALGPESERTHNLNRLAHLVHVIQHELALNTEKEK